ncbi:synaptonemal complex protein 2-like [Pseudopipra pipra]|uniref:synaptonemal complex protein 2-like n=1 Tax=Pseudopipra pipra TaxID=415032 RepID=UPI003139584B
MAQRGREGLSEWTSAFGQNKCLFLGCFCRRGFFSCIFLFFLKEEKSEEWNRDVSGNMAGRAEDYLESLLTDAFKGKGFEKISELLQEREVEPRQKYSESLFSQLDKALRKELDKNEFQNVSLLLKCIQVYFKSDFQEGKSLFIEQGLVAKLVSWFERARAFVILIDPNENKFFEDFFDTALVICKCSIEAVFYMETSPFLAVTFQNIFLGKKDLLNLFLPELGHLVTEANLCCTLHLEALRTLNSILDNVTREERKQFPLSEEMCSLTKDLAKTILEVGDYDLQVGLSEALCRLMIKKWRDDLVHHWFEDNYLAEAFKEIKDREFETDCRKFLNLLNERLGNERRVYSFPCISAFADTKEVKKPSDEKLEEFWIDFNTGSQSVTFYVDSNEGFLWDSVRLSKEAVSSYRLEEDGGQKIVKILMKKPAALTKTEATKIKLVFSAEFEILGVLKKVLGDEKFMQINETEEKSVHAGKQTRENETVIAESSNAQRRKDPSNSENMETLSDNLTSEKSQQLTHTVAVSQKMVNSGVAVVTVSQQTDLEDANQGSGQASVPKAKAIVSLPSSAKKSKTPSPGMKAKPSEKPLEEESREEDTPKDVAWEKRNRKRSLAKQRAEDRKEVFDFENSDSSSHEKVAEAKGKILGQKASSQNQSFFNYRKHLFSESNNENISSGQSEKSWILDSQIQSVPKSVDYTRKRTRVRSKLKVLPMSSASSGSDYVSKKGGESRKRIKKEMQREKSRFSTKGGDLPTVDHADETLSKEPKEDSLSPGVSARSYSSDVEKAVQKLHEAPGNLTREEESTKRKDSDTLESTVIKKLKFSSWETNHSSSDTNYKPRKIFDSVEEEAEIQKGQEMDDSVDDVFFSKMQHEDFSHSGVITAFESFVDQLKKLFWARYKRMEISTQNALRSSEKNLSALLNQIHQCRLNKLETFQKIVVDELSSLEKETQILANMEKDAVDFWNAHLLKLNSFCNQQKQRIESVDSAVGESVKSFADSIQNTTVRYM